MDPRNLMDVLTNIPVIKLGVLALGMFVGWLLGYGLLASKASLRAALTVVGAALGGGPILFIKGLGDEKWFYPIGLLLGLLWLHAWQARGKITNITKQQTGSRPTASIFAWIDIIIIAIATLSSVIYAAIRD